MAQEKKNDEREGINIGDIKANESLTIGDIVSGDNVGGDKITIQDVAHSTIAIGSADASGSADLAAVLQGWQATMEQEIEALPDLSPADKQDLKEQTAKIKAQVEETQVAQQKGAATNLDRLERLINTLAVMAPDIFEVAAATIANPLAGLGLVLKKIGQKVKLEQQAKSA